MIVTSSAWTIRLLGKLKGKVRSPQRFFAVRALSFEPVWQALCHQLWMTNPVDYCETTHILTLKTRIVEGSCASSSTACKTCYDKWIANCVSS
mmetsp:Transcript_44685/g.107786  ORF Transcript_44685/g.107786 Transcript_44685/m.107786 type:complete len:93 (-) Transcript_44685:182-460(-)